MKWKLFTAVVVLTALSGGLAVTLQRPQSSFLGGEISPLLLGRADMAQYEMGLRELENGLVVDVGCITRRPGSVYVATTQGDEPARLESFIYDESDSYVLEFTAGKLRFFRDTGQIQGVSGAYEVNTVYNAPDLEHLQIYQSADVSFIVDGNHIPQKLSRYDHNDWTMEDVNITTGPFRSMNITATTVEVNDVNNTVTMMAVVAGTDPNLFYSTHEGALWRIQQVMPSQAVSGTFTGTGNSTEVVAGITAPYSVQFSAVAFRGTIELQVSYDEGATWVSDYVARNATSTSMDANTVDSSDYGQNVLMRVACTAFTSGSVDYELNIDSYVHTGIVRITTYIDPNEVQAEVLDRIGIASARTTMWSEGAWSDYRGYPNAITGHFGRLLFAKDLKVWWSKVEDYNNFYPGVNDDQAFTWTASLARQNPIRWLVGERSQHLICGTLGKIIELRSLDELSGFTPTNPPKVTSATAVTVGTPLPALADNVLLFTDRTTRHIYEMVYDNAEESVTAPDLTIMASHITGTGIVQLAWQRSPYPMLWCVRADGEMASLYYNRPYKVAAWSRQVTDGSYTSVAVVPTSGGYDRLWMVVKRNGHYYVEYLKDIDMDAAIDDAFYVDSGLTWDGGTGATITAITKANPATVTLATWPTGLTDGDNLRIESVVGMTEINDRVFTADDCNSTAKTLTLDNAAGNADWNTLGYTSYTSGGTLTIVENSFAGLDHLEGNEVTILGDGAVLATETVEANTIVLDEYYNTVTVGLPYTTTITPTEVDVSAEHLPFFKTIKGLYLRVYCTTGGKVGVNGSNLKEIPWSRSASATTWASSPELYSGSFILGQFGGSRRDATFTLVCDDPLPFTLLGAIPMYEVTP